MDLQVQIYVLSFFLWCNFLFVLYLKVCLDYFCKGTQYIYGWRREAADGRCRNPIWTLPLVKDMDRQWTDLCESYIMEYPDLEGTFKDQQSPGAGRVQDSPKNHTICIDARQGDGAEDTQGR